MSSALADIDPKQMGQMEQMDQRVNWVKSRATEPL
jgi:hypothetical protein